MKTKILKIIWWVYIVLLFIFVVVKFKGSFIELSERIRSYSNPDSIHYNLIPFRSIYAQISRITQWLGSVDVDDIILNMMGIIWGYLIFLLINRIVIKEQ